MMSMTKEQKVFRCAARAVCGREGGIRQEPMLEKDQTADLMVTDENTG
jgi:hypothetical protein